jgi:hypothetical protein
MVGGKSGPTCQCCASPVWPTTLSSYVLDCSGHTPHSATDVCSFAAQAMAKSDGRMASALSGTENATEGSRGHQL